MDSYLILQEVLAMRNKSKYQELVKEFPHLFTEEGLKVITDENEIAEFEKKEKEAGRNTEIGVVYESPWRYMLRDLVKTDSGKMFGYERVVPVRTGGAAVLPMYNDQVLLIRQYRHPVQGWRWEIPRGFGTEGATAEKNAAKELFEEAGISENEASFERLGSLNTDSGLTSDEVSLFVAKISALNISLLNKEDSEVISHVRLFGMAEIRDMVAAGEIKDSFTLSALGIWMLQKT